MRQSPSGLCRSINMHAWSHDVITCDVCTTLVILHQTRRAVLVCIAVLDPYTSPMALACAWVMAAVTLGIVTVAGNRHFTCVLHARQVQSTGSPN